MLRIALGNALSELAVANAKVTGSDNALNRFLIFSLVKKAIGNKIIKTNDVPVTGNGLYLSQNYLGYYSGSAWNSYISSSGQFLFKKDDNNFIKF